MFGYRTGAKKTDVNKIKRMTEEGRTVDEISRMLLIVPSCVQSFVDAHSNKAKPKSKAGRPKREPLGETATLEDI